MRTYTRVNDRSYPSCARVYICVCVCVPLLSLPLPFRELRALRRPGFRAATVTTNDGSLCWRGVGSLLVGVRRRACVEPPPPPPPLSVRRLTEGRSLPGDSTLVCAAYHQFPLILNRIQRTKPVTTPTTPRRPPDVYIGIEAPHTGCPGVSLRLRIPVINVESRFP